MVLVLLAALSASASTFTGFYTGSAAYNPGGFIDVHASWDGDPVEVQFRVVDLQGAEVVRSDTKTLGPQDTALGSFVEVPRLDLAGEGALTIEGFVYPNMIGTDTVVLAGQASATEATVALGIDAEGRAFAVADTGSGPVRATASQVLDLDAWVHLALTWDGTTLAVLVNGVEAASTPLSGTLAAKDLPFRVGARAEAPGWMSGVADARLDDLVVWKRALSAAELASRAADGMAGHLVPPTPSDVHLYYDFEDGAGGMVRDGSSNGYNGALVNHGHPAMAGVVDPGRSLRLNHDQLVDANWEMSAQLLLPADLASGLYVMEVLPGPDFLPQNSFQYEELVVVRPAVSSAPMAVIVPVNTWMAYNGWPAVNYGVPEEEAPGMPNRPRTPGAAPVGRQGNNSAYYKMGDGVSLNHYMSWKRPNEYAVLNGISRAQHEKGVQSAMMMKWLADVGYDVDVYTQRDLATGAFDPSAYSALLLHGHSEFWSREEFDALSQYLDGGGSLISLGGNMSSWRVAYDDQDSFEMARYTQFGGRVGQQDNYSAVDGGLLTAWLTIRACEGDVDTNIRGTINDIVIQPNCTDCYGLWRPDAPEHWLMAGLNLSASDRFGVDGLGERAAGHETDRYVPGFEPMGVADGQQVTVLATGVEFGGEFTRINYDVIAQATCDELSGSGIMAGVSTVVSDEEAPSETGGSIAYYPHRGGGRVLSVGGVLTPSTLGHDAVMTALVSHAIDCFALGQGCDEVRTPLDPTPAPRRGCGCDAQGRSLAWGWLLLPVFGLGRRCSTAKREG